MTLQERPTTDLAIGGAQTQLIQRFIKIAQASVDGLSMSLGPVEIDPVVVAMHLKINTKLTTLHIQLQFVAICKSMCSLLPLEGPHTPPTFCLTYTSHFQSAPKERRRRRAEKRSRVLLESPFLLCPLKVCS